MAKNTNTTFNITSINPWDEYSGTNALWTDSAFSDKYVRPFRVTINGLTINMLQSQAQERITEHFQWTEMAKENESFAKQLEQLRVMYKLYAE